MPAFGLGTWKSANGKVREAVAEALRVGYMHVDAAWIIKMRRKWVRGLVR